MTNKAEFDAAAKAIHAATQIFISKNVALNLMTVEDMRRKVNAQVAIMKRCFEDVQKRPASE